jgi:hypothetical protein
MARTAHEVFEDHLRCRLEGKLEEDLQRNYSVDVVLLCEFGVLRGHNALRESADRLSLQVPGANFQYLSKQVADEYAFLKWRAESDVSRLEHGADSFVIRDGQIVMQSIYYELQAKE